MVNEKHAVKPTPEEVEDQAIEITEKVEPAKPETVRVSCAIPAEQYERLFNGDRYDQRKEKGEYLGFIIDAYDKALPAKNTTKV